jgi:quinohemoprotein ethanol dehydrogenase
MPEVRRRALVLPEPPPLSADAATVAAGDQLFREHCGVCHGLGAFSANVIPDLRYMTAQTHKDFQSIVAGARAGRGMPPFAGRLAPEQVEQIRAYLIERAHDRRAELQAAGQPPSGT